jgi:hypothetical protein
MADKNKKTTDEELEKAKPAVEEEAEAEDEPVEEEVEEKKKARAKNREGLKKEAKKEGESEEEEEEEDEDEDDEEKAVEDVTVLDADLLFKGIENLLKPLYDKIAGIEKLQKGFIDEVEKDVDALITSQKYVMKAVETWDEPMQKALGNLKAEETAADELAKATPETKADAKEEAAKTEAPEVLEKSTVGTPEEAEKDAQGRTATERKHVAEVFSKAMDLQEKYVDPDNPVLILKLNDLQDLNRGKVTSARLAEIEKAVKDAEKILG